MLAGAERVFSPEDGGPTTRKKSGNEPETRELFEQIAAWHPFTVDVLNFVDLAGMKPPNLSIITGKNFETVPY